MRRLLLLVAICLLVLVSCAPQSEDGADGRIRIIAASFPAYDAARAIVGEEASLSMLLPVGTDSHSYEPSLEDAVRMAEADLFIYNGGESDSWIDSLVSSLDGQTVFFRLVDNVPTLYTESEEGIVQGEEDHDHDHGHEALVDEHVWTSLSNEMAIVDALCGTIAALDPGNASLYRERADDYIAQIASLRERFGKLVRDARRHVIVVADRFPLLYFAREFSLDWIAAYPGCAAESEPSVRTVAALVDYVRDNDVPAVLHMELSNTMLSETVAGETGAEVLQFNSVHNVSKRDFDNGVSYVSLMEENLATLKEALY